MGKLLKFEWRKLWQQKSLYLVFVLGLLSITLFMILSQIFLDMFHATKNATESLVQVLGLSSFPSLISIFITLFACNDHYQHTIKNIYSRGYSRSAVYFSKYLVSLFTTLLVVVLYMGYGFLFALIQGGYVASIPAWKWGQLALQFLVVFGFHGLFFGISMIIGKLAGSLAINLIGITLVFGLLKVVFQIFQSNFDIMAYHPEMIMSNLLGEAPLTKVELIRAIVAPISYAFVAIVAGWLVNNRRDV